MPISYPQSSPLTIVSTTAPTNPQAGTQWLEVDASNNLIESWYWLSNTWRSKIEIWNINLILRDNSIVFNSYSPLPAEYDYFLKHCLVSANNLNNQLTSSNSFTVKMTANENNITPSTAPSITLNSQASSDFIVSKINWNYLLSSSSSNKGLRILINKTSNLTGDLAIKYHYQAIRK